MNTPDGNQGGFGQPQPQHGWSGPGSSNPGASQGGYNQPTGSPGMPGPYGAQTDYGAPQPPKSKKKIFVAIGGGILALILIAGAAFFFVSGGFSSEERAKKEVLSALRDAPKPGKDGKTDFRQLNERLCKSNQLSDTELALLESLAKNTGADDTDSFLGVTSNDKDLEKLTTDDVTIDPNDPNKATVKEPNTGTSITMVKEDGKWVIC